VPGDAVTAVAIHGVGTSRFARQPDRTPAEIAAEAAAEALADAGIDRVDAAYVGTVFGAPGVAQRALRALGLTRIPIVTVEAACASGTVALHEARVAVESGRYERVLALGIEHLTTTFDGPIAPEPTDPEGRAGMLLPAIYAMSAARYQAVHGLRDDELAAVAVKNSRHGARNPRALRRRPLTAEEVLASAPIAGPLTLLQCCSLSDAAAAAVVAPATGGAGEVRIRSSALRSGGLWDQRSDHAWGFEVVRDTARDAYEAAGLGIDDVDVLEVHDAFTIGEIVTIEALGLAAEGQGGRLALAGDTALGGRRPVNPSGGLLARGHPLGATGLAQTAEIVWQLRDEAGERQVEGARIGIVETMGGGAAGLDGNACVVAVLEGPGR
jgi:acetyl-CoA C-acetyltransferase